MDSLHRWMFGQLAINGITLDLDSTVMTRYGKQEAAVRGYNPAKRRRASHHPLIRHAKTRLEARPLRCPKSLRYPRQIHNNLCVRVTG